MSHSAVDKDSKEDSSPKGEEKSFFNIIVHSFFIIPFLIAVFCVLLFVAINLLTRENRTVYDYLNDVKVGSLNKRWQGAFELSKILANPKLLPKDSIFYSQLTSAFKEADHDDPKVQQYLALAMGRTQKKQFTPVLMEALKTAKPETVTSIIYALGMLKDPAAVNQLTEFADDPQSNIRSITVVALGNIADEKSIPVLQKALADSEPNVQWGSAISLAQMGNDSGKNILSQLLNRSYYSQFTEVDAEEQTDLLLSAVEAAGKLNDSTLNQKISELAASDPNMKVRALAQKISNK